MESFLILEVFGGLTFKVNNMKAMKIWFGLMVVTFMSISVYTLMTQQYGLMFCNLLGVLLSVEGLWYSNVKNK